MALVNRKDKYRPRHHLSYLASACSIRCRFCFPWVRGFAHWVL